MELNRINELMQMHNISQLKLAKALGEHQPHISFILSGKRKSKRLLHRLEAIGRYLEKCPEPVRLSDLAKL